MQANNLSYTATSYQLLCMLIFLRVVHISIPLGTLNSRSAVIRFSVVFKEVNGILANCHNHQEIAITPNTLRIRSRAKKDFRYIPSIHGPAKCS